MAGRNWIVALIAIALGLVAVVLANAWFSGKAEQQQQAVDVNRLTQIVVATQPLEYGGKLNPQNIKLQSWPASSVPQGAFVTIAEALRDGRVALRPIVIGEPILADKVSGTRGRAELAALLPDGMRAFPIPIDALDGVAGFVLPGSMVDVLLTRKIPGQGTTSEDLRSDLLLSAVQVLAIDQAPHNKEGKPKVGRTATVVVSLYDAQRLVLARKMGTLSLVLRKVDSAAGGDEELAAAGPTSTTLIGNRITPPPMVLRRRTGEGGGSAPPARVQFVAAPAAPAPRTAPALPATGSGGMMTVFRGSEPTVYPVGLTGGR